MNEQATVWTVEYLWNDDWGVQQAETVAIHGTRRGAMRKKAALHRQDGTAFYRIVERKVLA